jgi:TolB protein
MDDWPDAYIHYLYKSSGTRVFPLAQLPGDNLTPTWNPTDPNWLAISLSYKGNPDIYLIRRDGKLMRQLTTSKSIEEAPCFSPNGQEIAFTSDRSGYPQIYVMSSDGSNARQLVSMPGYACDTAQWSPVPVGGVYGSYKISFRAYPLAGVRGDIYVVNADGTDLVNLTQQQYDNSNPSWSPDGQYIAFSSTRAGGKAEIWVMEADGSNPRRLTYIPGQNLSPAWSPAPAP